MLPATEKVDKIPKRPVTKFQKQRSEARAKAAPKEYGNKLPRTRKVGFERGYLPPFQQFWEALNDLDAQDGDENQQLAKYQHLRNRDNVANTLRWTQMINYSKLQRPAPVNPLRISPTSLLDFFMQGKVVNNYVLSAPQDSQSAPLSHMVSHIMVFKDPTTTSSGSAETIFHLPKDQFSIEEAFKVSKAIEPLLQRVPLPHPRDNRGTFPLLLTTAIINSLQDVKHKICVGKIQFISQKNANYLILTPIAATPYGTTRIFDDMSSVKCRLTISRTRMDIDIPSVAPIYYTQGWLPPSDSEEHLSQLNATFRLAKYFLVTAFQRIFTNQEELERFLEITVAPFLHPHLRLNLNLELLDGPYKGKPMCYTTSIEADAKRGIRYILPSAIIVEEVSPAPPTLVLFSTSRILLYRVVNEVHNSFIASGLVEDAWLHAAQDCDIMNSAIEAGEELGDPPCDHTPDEMTVMQHVCQYCGNSANCSDMRRKRGDSGFTCPFCFKVTGDPVFLPFVLAFRSEQRIDDSVSHIGREDAFASNEHLRNLFKLAMERSYDIDSQTWIDQYNTKARRHPPPGGVRSLKISWDAHFPYWVGEDNISHLHTQQNMVPCTLYMQFFKHTWLPLMMRLVWELVRENPLMSQQEILIRLDASTTALITTSSHLKIYRIGKTLDKDLWDATLESWMTGMVPSVEVINKLIQAGVNNEAFRSGLRGVGSGLNEYFSEADRQRLSKVITQILDDREITHPLPLNPSHSQDGAPWLFGDVADIPWSWNHLGDFLKYHLDLMVRWCNWKHPETLITMDHLLLIWVMDWADNRNDFISVRMLSYRPRSPIALAFGHIHHGEAMTTGFRNVLQPTSLSEYFSSERNIVTEPRCWNFGKMNLDEAEYPMFKADFVGSFRSLSRAFPRSWMDSLPPLHAVIKSLNLVRRKFGCPQRYLDVLAHGINTTAVYLSPNEVTGSMQISERQPTPTVDSHTTGTGIPHITPPLRQIDTCSEPREIFPASGAPNTSPDARTPRISSDITEITNVIQHGLTNEGNTCFLNSAVQFLNSHPRFVQAFANPEGQLPQQRLCMELTQIVRAMQDTSSSKTVNMKGFCTELWRLPDVNFPPGTEHDAGEFVVWLLAYLGFEGQPSTPSDGQFLESLQKSLTISSTKTLRCIECDSMSQINDLSTHIYLSLPQNDIKASIRLESLLELRFAAGDEIVDHNCSKNLEHRRGIWSPERLWYLPSYLIIGFQRTLHSSGTSKRNNTFVPTVRKLSMWKFLHPDVRAAARGIPLQTEYRLVAVIRHYALGDPENASSESGHYKTIRLVSDGSWSICNDQWITPFSDEDNIKDDGVDYMLLYEKLPQSLAEVEYEERAQHFPVPGLLTQAQGDPIQMYEVMQAVYREFISVEGSVSPSTSHLLYMLSQYGFQPEWWVHAVHKLAIRNHVDEENPGNDTWRLQRNMDPNYKDKSGKSLYNSWMEEGQKLVAESGKSNILQDLSQAESLSPSVDEVCEEIEETSAFSITEDLILQDDKIQTQLKTSKSDAPTYHQLQRVFSTPKTPTALITEPESSTRAYLHPTPTPFDEGIFAWDAKSAKKTPLTETLYMTQKTEIIERVKKRARETTQNWLERGWKATEIGSAMMEAVKEADAAYFAQPNQATVRADVMSPTKTSKLPHRIVMSDNEQDSDSTYQSQKQIIEKLEADFKSLQHKNAFENEQATKIIRSIAEALQKSNEENEFLKKELKETREARKASESSISKGDVRMPGAKLPPLLPPKVQDGSDTSDRYGVATLPSTPKRGMTEQGYKILKSRTSPVGLGANKVFEQGRATIPDEYADFWQSQAAKQRDVRVSDPVGRRGSMSSRRSSTSSIRPPSTLIGLQAKAGESARSLRSHSSQVLGPVLEADIPPASTVATIVSTHSSQARDKRNTNKAGKTDTPQPGQQEPSSGSLIPRSPRGGTRQRFVRGVQSVENLWEAASEGLKRAMPFSTRHRSKSTRRGSPTRRETAEKHIGNDSPTEEKEKRKGRN